MMTSFIVEGSLDSEERNGKGESARHDSADSSPLLVVCAFALVQPYGPQPKMTFIFIDDATLGLQCSLFKTQHPWHQLEVQILLLKDFLAKLKGFYEVQKKVLASGNAISDFLNYITISSGFSAICLPQRPEMGISLPGWLISSLIQQL